MPLITCPECNREISSKASSCPGCGCPVEIVDTTKPELPNDLSIGKQVVNWGLNAAVSGIFDPMFCSDSRIKNGKDHLLVCERGIRVAGSFYVSLIDIHFSQILSLEFLPDSKVLEKEKSVIGRAAAGFLVLGPLAGLVGGMSGIGSKHKKLSSLVLNYWDVQSDSAYTIILFTKKELIARDATAKLFCDNVKEKLVSSQNSLQNNSAGEKPRLEEMEQEIYLSRDGSTYGPYSKNDLRGFLNSNNAHEDDLVCEDGHNWVQLKSIL